MTPPETRYANSSDVHIAYQMVGDGPLDLIFVPGFVSNVELAWESPGQTHFLSRLAAFSRLIRFDKRGVGLSDGGAMSMLFAATYPERTRALTLYGSYARHPTLTPEALPHHIELIERV